MIDTTTTVSNTAPVTATAAMVTATVNTATTTTTTATLSPTTSATVDNNNRQTFYHWCLYNKQGMRWVWGCAMLGFLFGFGIGSGWITTTSSGGAYYHGNKNDNEIINQPPNAWRIRMGARIRTSTAYKLMYPDHLRRRRELENDFYSYRASRLELYTIGVLAMFIEWSGLFNFTEYALSLSQYSHHAVVVSNQVDNDVLRSNPSHPYVYAVLREAIVREKGGYVHPDLGILEPAPCGAARGIGMVRNTYHSCQTHCLPGVASEKMEAAKNSNSQQHSTGTRSRERYRQEEVLIKVPLAFQMTRKVALDTLLPRISAEIQRKANVHELDDAALLVLLLAHERGVGRYSRWLPYIASLPLEPSCGYTPAQRPYKLDAINVMRDELGMDVNGWPGELVKASHNAERIVNALTKDYGASLSHPKGVSAHDNIAWSLCQVASRATGGSQKHGALRMVPLLDMINHDFNAAGFVELTGEERLEEGDFVDAIDETDKGAFVLRSLRHGRHKALRVGQELLANYNVPHYSALDWFVSSGFVPPERYEPWQKLDAPLPRIRRDGPFADPLYDASGSTGGRHVLYEG